ncbi:MAG TPA: hypothetical protein VF750_02090 [Sphingomicrobium sp.]
MSFVGRLLLLFSVLLMPLGMGAAAASVPAPGHHGMMAAAAVEHCPDQSNKPSDRDGVAACTMACASALPAQDLARDSMPVLVHQPTATIAEQSLHGVQPEIATPPPKIA